MLVLALDTTGPHCSACVARAGEVLAHASERIGRGHAERLAPMVVEVLAQAGVAPNAVERLAVCTGPGSFTGLRVALSYAKGFALPRRLPVIGIDALGLTLMAQGEPSLFAHVWADVKRGQIMWGQYCGPGPLLKGYPKTGDREEMEHSAALMQDDIIEAATPDVALLARIAATLPEDHIESYPAQPLYARAPDAKLPGGVSP